MFYHTTRKPTGESRQNRFQRDRTELKSGIEVATSIILYQYRLRLHSIFLSLVSPVCSLTFQGPNRT